MLDIPMQMYYKSTFHIQKNASTGVLFDDVVGFVYDYICSELEVPLAFDQFVSHCYYDAPDHSIKAQTASYHNQQNTYWALKIRLHDIEINRRKWYINIGVSQEKSNKQTLVLSYAHFYTDYVAGLMSLLQKPIPQTPDFVLQIVHEDAFDCTVTNLCQLPISPVALDEMSADFFLDTLFDDTRKLPLIVVTCPDLLNPHEIAALTLGNTVVFVIAEPYAIEEINRSLPSELKIVFDALHVYPLIKDSAIQARIYRGDLIQRSDNRILWALRQSFCEGTYSHERKYFTTYDGIMRLRDPDKAASLEVKNKSLDKKLQLTRDELNELKERLASTESLLDQNLVGRVAELEAVLLDSMIKEEAVKRQLKSIATALYSNSKMEANDLPAIKEIALVLEAIGYLFDRQVFVGNGKNALGG